MEQDLEMRYRVIGVGTPGGMVTQLDALLHAAHGEIVLVSKAQAAIDMVRTLGPVDMMLVEYPFGEENLEEFFAELYYQVKRPPRLVVLCSDADGARLPDLTEWNCTVLSFERRLRTIATALRTMLERAPRVAARLMVRLEVAARSDRFLRLAQTENISKSGMLVRTDEEFPPEALVRFELSFPEEPEPVCGRARVVRFIDPGREKTRGVGVKFQAMLGADQLRLERFLMRALDSGRPAAYADGSEPMAAAGGG